MRHALCALWVLCALWGLTLNGCSDAPAPSPELHGLAPSQATSDLDVAVEISGSALTARVVTDFEHSEKSALDATFLASLTPHDGAVSPPIALLDVRLTDAGTLQATVPAGVPRGTYDLVVVDPAQRTMTLRSAYRVVASAETVAGFRIEPIGPQRARCPFTVSLAAVDVVGRVVDGFSGSARLSDQSGALSPTDTGPFVLGRARVQVTVAMPIASNALTVTDDLGHASTADVFEVKAGLPVALTVRSPPQTLVVGACSPPLEVEIVDVFGEPAQAETSLRLAFRAGPLDDVRFFTEAACATAATEVQMRPGDSRAVVHFLTLRAGRPTLRIESESLPSIVQQQTVSPGGPARLTFATPGQVVKTGTCSAGVSVEVLDAHENPSPVAEALAVIVATGPGTGGEASLHPDPDCATPLGAFGIAAGTASSPLYFMGRAPGALRLELTSALGTAWQEETITP